MRVNEYRKDIWKLKLDLQKSKHLYSPEEYEKKMCELNKMLENESGIEPESPVKNIEENKDFIIEHRKKKAEIRRKMYIDRSFDVCKICPMRRDTEFKKHKHTYQKELVVNGKVVCDFCLKWEKEEDYVGNE